MQENQVRDRILKPPLKSPVVALMARGMGKKIGLKLCSGTDARDIAN